MTGGSSESKSTVSVDWSDVFEEEMTYLGYKTTTLGTTDEPRTNRFVPVRRRRAICNFLWRGTGILRWGKRDAHGKRDMLRKFDYVSTVSGGGYAGAALSYWSVKEKDPDQGSPLISSLVHMAKRGLTGETQDSASSSQKPKPTDPFEYHPSYIRASEGQYQLPHANRLS